MRRVVDDEFKNTDESAKPTVKHTPEELAKLKEKLRAELKKMIESEGE
jgi:hypothetical protein